MTNTDYVRRHIVVFTNSQVFSKFCGFYYDGERSHFSLSFFTDEEPNAYMLLGTLLNAACFVTFRDFNPL